MKNHFSPIFANKAWANNKGYVSYHFCGYNNKVLKGDKGYKQWGRKNKLYTDSVELSLNKELETDSSHIYK